MNVPTSEEVWSKNHHNAKCYRSENCPYGYDDCGINKYYDSYVNWLEQQYKEMLEALIYEYASVCETCKHDCSMRDGGCHQQAVMKKAIESATGLTIEEAIKRYED